MSLEGKQKEIDTEVGKQIRALREVTESKFSSLEARVNELALYQDDAEPLQHIDATIISKPTDKKNLKTMVVNSLQLQFEAILADIEDNGIGEHFSYSILSSADQKAFRKMYKVAISADITKRKAEITSTTGVEF